MEYLEKEERPWGRYYVIHDQENYKIKRIEVEPGQRLSYQFHEKRSETWVIVKGKGMVIIDEKQQNISEGETILIPKKSRHRIENISDNQLVFIEVQTGTYFGEDDIVRLSDDYNRS